MADRNGPYSGMHEEVAAVCHNGGLPGCVSRPGCSEPRCRGSGFGPGQTEKWLAESTGDEAVHLAAEISFRRYLASVDMGGCPGEFKCAFLRYAKLLNSFEEKDLNSVADFPAVPLQAAGRELFRVLLTYRLEPEHLLEEMKALVDEEIEGKEELSAGQMMDIVRGMREALQSGSRPFPAERPPEDRVSGM